MKGWRRDPKCLPTSRAPIAAASTSLGITWKRIYKNITIMGYKGLEAGPKVFAHFQGSHCCCLPPR